MYIIYQYINIFKICIHLYIHICTNIIYRYKYIRYRYRHDLAMPPEEYSPLQQLLLDPELHVVKALADVCHLDRVPLANSLLRIFRYK
jgi:hypothetical protein